MHNFNWQCYVIVLFLSPKKEQSLSIYHLPVFNEICEHALTITGPYLNHWSGMILCNKNSLWHARIQRGDRGPDPPHALKKTQNKGLLSNTGPDPLKITKLPKQHSMLGHHLSASETPFKWRFAGGPDNGLL